jgi:glycosyltransferase involved in cell wall biosynthesis
VDDKGNLLVVAHAFPPSGGAGARRVSKVVKYIHRWGWNITVLVPKRGELFAHPYDPHLSGEIPTNVKIVESFTPEKWMMNIYGTRGGGEDQQANTTQSIWTMVYRWLYKTFGNLLAVPESAITWLPFAICQGLRIIKKSRIDLIFSTGPPFSVLLIGAILKKLSGKPLISEFRDAWIADPTRKYEDTWRHRIEKVQESWAIHNSDVVISVTNGVTQDFFERYSNVDNPPKKFRTIQNGYDEDDFYGSRKNTASEIDKDKTFNIVYTGTLGGVRTPKYFLQAVQKLISKKPCLRSQMKILFVGQFGRFSDGLSLDGYINRYDLKGIVENVGFVSREESLNYQRQADLLLLITGIVPANQNRCYGLSAKVFDYTLAKRPILAISEQGPTADFVRSAGIGNVISHFHQNDIGDAIIQAIDGDYKYKPQQSIIESYNYSSLLRELDLTLLDLLQ